MNPRLAMYYPDPLGHGGPTPNMTPLEQQLRDALGEGPRSPDRLCRALRRAGGTVPVDLIERTLRAQPDLFVPVGDGTWDLAEHGRVAPQAAEVPQDWFVDPLIAGAVRHEFVVVDVESTGTSEQDDIVQVAAAVMRHGVCVRAFNRYVRPERVALSESHRVRFGWAAVPDERLTPLATAMTELRAFIGQGPTVAWNARFDQRMLGAAGCALPGLVDGLAVAAIVYPSSRLGLGAIAAAAGIEVDGLPADLAIVGDAPQQFGAHDALFDVYLTGLVYAQLVAELEVGIGSVSALIPEMGAAPSPRATFTTERLSGATPAAAARDNLARIVQAAGRETREAQAQVAELAGEALGGASAIVEAPTGTGKTLAYVSAALASVAAGERVALVTAYRNLQDQLLTELQDAARLLRLGTRIAVLKGGDNYLCRRRLAHVEERTAEADVDLRFVCAVVERLLEHEPKATREDVSAWVMEQFPRARALLDEVAVACHHEGCGRQAAIEAANEAELVVLNQVLWMGPPVELVLPARAVIDEAHDLEEMATLALTEMVDSAGLHRLVNRLDPAGRRGLIDAAERDGLSADAARTLARRVRGATDAMWLPLAKFATAVAPDFDLERGGRARLRRAPKLLHPAAWTAAEDALRNLRDALTRLAAELEALARDPQLRDPLAKEDLFDLAGRAREAEDLLWKLPAVQELADVHYIDLEGGERPTWSIARSPIEVAPRLQEQWDSLAGFLLISATLQTGQSDFGFVVDRLGLWGRLGGGTHAIGADFPFAENIVFGLARWLDSIPTPRFQDEFIRDTAAEIEALARFGDGRQLALFTARSRLSEVAARIREPLAQHGMPVLAQGDGGRTRLLEDFRERKEAVLLGTRSFWQGVDVPGESLSFLVLEKLPYPHVRDPITEARVEAARRRSGSEFDDYLLPLMIITLKQGFGRLMRQRDDQGAVVLLDRRLHTKPYQRRVLDALPGFVPRQPESERSRKAFYRHIDACLPGLISAQGREFLESLGDDTAPVIDLPDLTDLDRSSDRRAAAIQALRSLFGHDDFRSPEQEELFWRILDGEDVIGLLPTGAGKSLPFQLAALTTPGVTLVISPLVALMRDQVENLLNRGIRAVGALVGAMSADERDEVLRRSQNRALRLLYVAPERLRDPVFLDRLSSLDVRRLVVDEAHCVSLWGPSFRPDFLAIRDALDHAGHPDPPVAALTATATPEIEADMRQALRIESAPKVGSGFGRPELHFAVLGARTGLAGDRITNRKQRMRLLIRVLTAADRDGQAAIVYVPTVREADQIATQLRQVGLLARAYHGKLDPWSRQNVEELFREGEIDIVVATKAFGMGIDRPDIRYVIHVGYPADLESYYQEAGRAGRDGEPSWCLLLTVERDRRTQDWFIDRVADLDATLQRAHSLIERMGSGCKLIDVEKFADELDLDETQVRVVLHHLVVAGVLTRLPDQTVVARVLRLSSIGDLELATALDAEGVPDGISAEVDLLLLGKRLGTDERDAEARLLAASRNEDLVYRPMVRHITVVIDTTARAPAPDTSRIVTAMRRKLDRMQSYASSAAECRQLSFRQYLGEAADDPCGTCDVCLGNRFPRPWMGVLVDQLPDADRLLDERLTVLAAVAWNKAEADVGRNPYGRWALQHILVGDRFNLVRNKAGVERERRLRRAEASPYWGALALQTNPSARVEKALDSLFHQGDITMTLHEPTRSFGDRDSSSGESSAYDVPALTEAGRRRLELGLVGD